MSVAVHHVPQIRSAAKMEAVEQEVWRRWASCALEATAGRGFTHSSNVCLARGGHRFKLPPFQPPRVWLVLSVGKVRILSGLAVCVRVGVGGGANAHNSRI